MALTYHLVLTGPVPEMLAELVRLRFGDVTIRRDAGQTVLQGLIADQSAIRALLNLLWDLGSDVRLLRVTGLAAPPIMGSPAST